MKPINWSAIGDVMETAQWLCEVSDCASWVNFRSYPLTFFGQRAGANALAETAQSLETATNMLCLAMHKYLDL